jgi:hypothetical protein
MRTCTLLVALFLGACGPDIEHSADIPEPTAVGVDLAQQLGGEWIFAGTQTSSCPAVLNTHHFSGRSRWTVRDHAVVIDPQDAPITPLTLYAMDGQTLSHIATVDVDGCAVTESHHLVFEAFSDGLATGRYTLEMDWRGNGQCQAFMADYTGGSTEPCLLEIEFNARQLGVHRNRD